MNQRILRQGSSWSRLPRVSRLLLLVALAVIITAGLAQLLKGKIEVDVMMATPDNGGVGWGIVDAVLAWIVATIVIAPPLAIGAVVTALRGRPKPVGATGDGTTTDRAVVVRVSVGFIALALITRLMTGGWWIILLAIPYLLICGAHALVHRWAGDRLSLGFADLVSLIGSNLLLLFAFLLQKDEGDGPAWVSIRALLQGGPGSPRAEPPTWFSFELSLLVFVPLVISWATLWALTMAIRRRTALRLGGPAVIVGLAAILYALLVAVLASPPAPAAY